MSSNCVYYILIILCRSWRLYNGNISQSLSTNNSTLSFHNGNGSLPRSASLSLSYHCHMYISLTSVAISTIEPSVLSITSMISTNIISTPSTPSPSPMSCSRHNQVIISLVFTVIKELLMVMVNDNFSLHYNPL